MNNESDRLKELEREADSTWNRQHPQTPARGLLTNYSCPKCRRRYRSQGLPDRCPYCNQPNP